MAARRRCVTSWKQALLSQRFQKIELRAVDRRPGTSCHPPAPLSFKGSGRRFARRAPLKPVLRGLDVTTMVDQQRRCPPLCRGLLCGGAAAVALAAAPAGSQAHPHMFVDAMSELRLDDAGYLTGLRTTMFIDAFTSLYVLEENGVTSPAVPLTQTQRDTIGADAAEGLGIYEYFTDLRVDEERLSFASAAVDDVQVSGERLVLTLDLTLAAPRDLRGRSLDLALYDPTFFADVRTMAPPVLPIAAPECDVVLTPFEPTQLESYSLMALSALSREETPDDPRIGAQFADRSAITCAL